MNITRVAYSSFLAVCLAVAANGAYPQAKQAAVPFEPEVGQQGKDVIWVPTADTLVTKMLDMAKVTANDYVMDLGSGDGRTVIAAARRGARALGIEYNPDMVELSKRNAERAGVAGKASFVKADLFESDFSQATVLTMFLLPSINLKLRPKILNLKPGTRVVSNSFSMGEWEADESASVDDDKAGTWRTALLWIVPAKVDGIWKLADAELTLKQDFQMLTGTFKSGANTAAINVGRMRGDEITFNAGGTVYTGRVSGNAMEGTFKSGSANGKWHATRAARP